MQALNLISADIPAVGKTDSGITALNWMSESRVSHLPVVDEDEYVGLLSDIDLYNMPNIDAPAVSSRIVLHRPFVYQNKHLFEVLDLAAKTRISVIPVLDDANRYVGSIVAADMVRELSSLISSDMPGAIIVLEMNVRDYSLSQISQIVEGNDTRILDVFVQNQPQSELIRVTLRLNRTDIASVLQTFERYSYSVIEIYSDDQQHGSMLLDRYNSFMKYLSI